MRVVGGLYGGRILKTLKGGGTRPTADKVRGAVFNMLGQTFAGGRVLDLYAGSGALAIEAVSRGCSQAVLVEKDRQAQAVIEANIQMTQEADKFLLIKSPAASALDQIKEPFDLIFLDPPYAQVAMETDIQNLQTRRLLRPDSRLVCETKKEVLLPDQIGSLEKRKEKIYGISKITIYQ